jgi:hypothetical protein
MQLTLNLSDVFSEAPGVYVACNFVTQLLKLGLKLSLNWLAGCGSALSSAWLSWFTSAR